MSKMPALLDGQVMFAGFTPDRSRGRYLAFNETGKLISQGDEPAVVMVEARKAGCACPIFLTVSLFDQNKAYAL